MGETRESSLLLRKWTYELSVLWVTGAYFAKCETKGFYPTVEVVFEIEDIVAHYHVPLLLSPFGYSTYRGS